MREAIFEVEFLSDIVLQASSNSEGKVEYLDYIPGSNFLGIAASKRYDYDNSFELFHSAKVRFMDGVPLIDDKPSYKTPFSYFHQKLDDTYIFNHHLIDDFSKFNQLKQLRSGYITKDKKFFELDFDYSQKSAYDSDTRRSKESAMYGYKALKRGSLWQFTLKYEDGVKNIDELKSSLIGKKRLGKSKSSQYGEIFIKEIDDKTQEPQKEIETKEVVLYANSRLALIDSDASPSYLISDILPSLQSKQVKWDRCQIRVSSFTPYNSARKTKDYQRVVINKGSVIVLKDITKEQLKELQKGVGAYQSEGFGDLLINPSFLMEESFKKESITTKKGVDKKELKIFENLSDDNTISYLMQKNNQKVIKFKLATRVQKFIDKNKAIYPQKMNSQWGTLRSLCMRYDDRQIVDEVEKYISKGVAEDKWDGKPKKLLIDALKDEDLKVDFLQLLSMWMPKQNRPQKGKKDV